MNFLNFYLVLCQVISHFINLFLADQANELMLWKESDTSTDKLGALLNFFILISKQGWAHVVLASSDYSLVYWLLGSRLRDLYLVIIS